MRAPSSSQRGMPELDSFRRFRIEGDPKSETPPVSTTGTHHGEAAERPSKGKPAAILGSNVKGEALMAENGKELATRDATTTFN